MLPSLEEKERAADRIFESLRDIDGVEGMVKVITVFRDNTGT